MLFWSPLTFIVFAEEIKLYIFGTAWGLVNDDKSLPDVQFSKAISTIFIVTQSQNSIN